MPTNKIAQQHFNAVYRHTVRNPNGYSISTGNKGTIEHDTQMCVHCGQHFDVVPGSGKVRGYCMMCNGVTCGNHACLEHFPLERRMDLYEKGRLPDLMASTDSILPTHKKFILTDGG